MRRGGEIWAGLGGERGRLEPARGGASAAGVAGAVGVAMGPVYGIKCNDGGDEEFAVMVAAGAATGVAAAEAEEEDDEELAAETRPAVASLTNFLASSRSIYFPVNVLKYISA